jgi:hypothetical protein
MQAKLYKTYRKRSYYQLRKLGVSFMSLGFLVLVIIVPLTLQVGALSSLESSSTASITNPVSSEGDVSEPNKDDVGEKLPLTEG